MGNLLLEVAITQARDVAGACEGGADRLSLAVGEPDDPRSPDLATAAAVLRESELPLRVLLRLNDGYTTTGGEFTRLVGLAEEYLALGAEGVVFGFLNSDVEVDADTCRALAEALPEVPWTFPRAVDLVLDPRHAWRDLKDLAGLTAVASGGSPQGLGHGFDDLLGLAERDPRAAAVLMPAGGLLAEHVPWFARVGVRQFQVDTQVRPGASYRAYVDSALVRSWRLLLDAAAERRA